MRILRFFMVIILMIAMTVSSCTDIKKNHKTKSDIKNANKIAGPQTIIIEKDQYNKIFYVSDNIGSDNDGAGSMERPWESLNFALASIKDAGESKKYAIIVAEGDYSKSTIQMRDYVDMYGGFSEDGWKRDIGKHRSFLDGQDKRRILVGANNARLDGFVLYDGSVRGNGAGIYCDSVSPHISNNTFFKNKTLKPIPWRPKFIHEMANDGGAIYCSNGSSTIVENNLFIQNTTENGRGGAVAFNHLCKPIIAGNVFFDNSAGIDDPMRSSDGGAISVFDWCDARIENNLILGNQALAKNDGGGVFVALWSSALIKGNVFVDNRAQDDAGGLFVGGQEHRYDKPLDPLPPSDKFFVNIEKNIFIGNKNPSMNSGAMRFTMESRGIFKENLTVFNNGIYFQRSEVQILNNTILDNFLYVDTKEGLKTGEISDNIIWADFDLRTEANVHNNQIKYDLVRDEQSGTAPIFKSDGMELKAESVIYSLRDFMTEVFVSGYNFRTDELANRIVRVGKRWGVIKSNDSSTIRLWGDFSDEFSFSVLPTYQLVEE